MRLDKYLKVSRLIKRRTVANEACDNGRVTANGRPVKASYDVKVGARHRQRTGAARVLRREGGRRDRHPLRCQDADGGGAVRH